MMREVVAASYGGPSSLEVRQVAEPVVGEDQVLVDVRAIGVNAWDVKSYSGTVGDDPAKLPLRLGAECAGVVVESRVPSIAVGAEVIVHPVAGAYADRVIAREAAVLPKPASLGWAEAAGLMLTGTAAAHLVAATAPDAGETVLVHGAAGGVGLMAVQLARHRGATVLGTALSEHHPLLVEMGVEPFDFRDDVAAWLTSRAPEGLDAVLDTVGTPSVLDLSLAAVKDADRVATLVPSAAALERGITQLGFGEGADPGTQLRRAARLDLLRAVEEGWLRVVVADTFSLDDAAAAHEAMVAVHAPGKIVLVP
ncbi:NADP-dependent oxidoreductase [Nocardioides sp. AN3]